MSANGIFEIEDTDIVRLDADGGLERSGWVNVGVFAVWIQLSATGGLAVSVHPRGAEGTELGNTSYTRQSAIDLHGFDPEAEN